MNKLCTRTLSELDGVRLDVRVDEYMKHRLQNKLIRAVPKDSLSSRALSPLFRPVFAYFINGLACIIRNCASDL